MYFFPLANDFLVWQSGSVVLFVTGVAPGRPTTAPIVTKAGAQPVEVFAVDLLFTYTDTSPLVLSPPIF